MIQKKVVLEALEEYNKYRSPEAHATLLDLKDTCFSIEFSGPFCASCGVYDYFEDLLYIDPLHSLYSLSITKIQGHSAVYVVTYCVSNAV